MTAAVSLRRACALAALVLSACAPEPPRGAAGAALLAPPPLVTPAAVTIQRADFTGAPVLGALHRGLNLNLIEDSSVRWDAAVPGNTGFPDVATDATFQGLMGALGVGSLRLPGGTLANYHDYDVNKAWVDWAINALRQFNKDPAIDWAGFWSFHAATGSLPLMSTANVYKSGSLNLYHWQPASAAASWVSAYRARGITGSWWETGNEVYSAAQVPGLEYPGSAASTGRTYLRRACHLSAAIKGADAAAQVGLVVYEHGSPGYSVLPGAADFCGLGAFDFFILHDYAPLYPRSAADLTFYQGGVERALTYQGLVRTVADLQAELSASYAAHAAKPIHVTEYGVLSSAAVDLGATGWYDKAAALLLPHHFFDLVVQGAGGLWYWEAVHSYFRLVDPGALSTTRLYDLLQRVFAQRGRLIAVPVSGGRTYSATGPIGSGCLEGEAESACWHVALGSGVTVTSQPYLKVFAAYHDGLLSRKVTVTVFNFAAAPHGLTLDLAGFALGGASWSVSQWQVSGASWDDALGGASTSSYSVASSGGAATLSSKLIPARSMVVFEIEL